MQAFHVLITAILMRAHLQTVMDEDGGLWDLQVTAVNNQYALSQIGKCCSCASQSFRIQSSFWRVCKLLTSICVLQAYAWFVCSPDVQVRCARLSTHGQGTLSSSTLMKT